MIKYKIEDFWTRIEKVEIIKETAKMLLRSDGGREYKSCSYYRYFDTWDEAHKELLERCEGKVNSLRLQLNQVKGELGNVKGMKKPD